MKLNVEKRKLKAERQLEAARVREADRLAVAKSQHANDLKAAMRLIPTLGLDEADNRIALSIAPALGEGLLCALPIHDSGGPRFLLLRLVSEIRNLARRQKAFGGPVNKVSRKQLNSVKARSKALMASLRDLPPDVDWVMANASGLGRVEGFAGGDFFQKLDRVAEEAARWLRGEQKQAGWRSKEVKRELEDRIAFSLALHGIPLTCKDKGLLSEALRVGYDELGIKAGGDTFRTTERLILRWSPDAVRKRAEREKLRSEIESRADQRANRSAAQLSRECLALEAIYTAHCLTGAATPTPTMLSRSPSVLFGRVGAPDESAKSVVRPFLQRLLGNTKKTEWPILRRAWDIYLAVRSTEVFQDRLEQALQFRKFESTWRDWDPSPGRTGASGRR